LVADYQILLYFLHHTPVLEKLTLQLSKVYTCSTSNYDVYFFINYMMHDQSYKVFYSPQEPKSGIELEGSSSMEQSLTLMQLKIVEVKCHIIDERVHNISKILSSCSISLAKIIIQKL
jgi:hypothetical protein